MTGAGVSLGGPCAPLPAASLVLLRLRGDCTEVLMGRRRRDLRFMPGFFVFPGGRLDPTDSSVTGNAYHNAALRECLEETGMAPGGRAAALVEIARAITPASSPVRFDTRFFLADADGFAQVSEPDGELESVGWYKAAGIEEGGNVADVTALVLKEALHRRHVGMATEIKGLPVMTYANGRIKISRP